MYQDLEKQNNDSENNTDGGISKVKYKTLYRDLKSYISKYLEADETEIGFLVLYATGTHFYEQYQNYPILHITGDFATGKNRRLDLLKAICFNPTILTSPTLPSLFRSIDESGCTILIDEADSLIKSEDVEGFLLAGYRKGVPFTRAVQDSTHPKGFRVEKFDVYCPKVLVTREGIESDPLNSRAMTIITFPKSAYSDIPDVLPDTALSEGKELKRRVVTMIEALNILKSSYIDLNLRGRDAEIFECITDVASIYGDEAQGDLINFITNVYVPDSKYDTMFSTQEDLIRALYECWKAGDIAYLSFLKEKLVRTSNDYNFISNKKIARVLRSLRFEVDRDDKRSFIIPNTKLLKVWTERYLSNTHKLADSKGSDSNDSPYVEAVEHAPDSEKVRPKRMAAMKRAISSILWYNIYSNS